MSATVITPFQSQGVPKDVPEGRAEPFYAELPLPELLKEIKAGFDSVCFHRNRMNKEMRDRLLPALKELKKRTYRKSPGYYQILREMGLVPDTVRSWFYEGPGEKLIEAVQEPQQEPEQDVAGETQGARTGKAMLLTMADKLARAVKENKLTYAKKLATQWIEARGL